MDLVVGEPLPLDLVNTRPRTGERLVTPADLAAWLTAEEVRLPLPTRPLTTADLDAVRVFRHHVGAVLAAARGGPRPPAAALRALTHTARAARPFHELGWDGTSVTVVRRRDGDYRAGLLGALADATIDLVGGPAIGRVRECEAADCTLLFLPVHPRRRWCSATACGNRARVARHYRRHRQPS